MWRKWFPVLSLLELILMELFTAMSKVAFVWHQIRAEAWNKFLLSASDRKCQIVFMEDAWLQNPSPSGNYWHNSFSDLRRFLVVQECMSPPLRSPFTSLLSMANRLVWKLQVLQFVNCVMQRPVIFVWPCDSASYWMWGQFVVQHHHTCLHGTG